MRGFTLITAVSLIVSAPILLGEGPPVNCSFDFECGDGDPCTVDLCVIGSGDPIGTGVCAHTPVALGEAGDCDDGIFCNGYEYCAPLGGGGPLVCTPGPAATCCDEICDERGRCDQSSVNEGALCDADAGCAGGRCERCPSDCRVRRCSAASSMAAQPCDDDADCPGGRCMTADENCAEDSQCNGAEVCDAATGMCRAGQDPCGFGALCFDRQCADSPAATRPCRNDSVCEGGTCQPASLQCFMGRCCSAAAEPVCTRATAASCTGHWYAGDVGYEDPAGTGPCGGHDHFNAPGAAWGCPLFSAGITSTFAQSVVQQPMHPAQIGPISLASASRTLGSYTGPIHAVGDDYHLQGPYGNNLEAVRFVGRCDAASDCAFDIDFRDENGTLVGTASATVAHLSQVRTHVVPVYPPMAVPVGGFVVFRAPEAEDPHVAPALYVMSTDDVDVGSGAPDVLWLNDGAISNFLAGGAAGVLSFELIGEQRLMPTSACCNAVTGACEERTPWDCAASSGTTRLAAYCAQCSGGEWNGNSCRTCQGGSEPGTESCSSQANCDDRALGGVCLPNQALCAGRGRCSNNTDRLCDTDVDCPTEANACSNADQFCTLDGDCPALGLCGGSGICVFGTCVEAGCGSGACCIAGTGECTVTANESSCQLSGGDFLGQGTGCQPNCCSQPNATGADQPEDAVVHNMAVPMAGGPPLTITLSGDNSSASNTIAAPDTCALFSAPGGIADLGWWEAFSIDACANVRVDLCCSNPVRTDAWTFLAADAACGTVIGPSPNPEMFDQMEFGTGSPHCDANQWHWFTGLQAGIYYLPVPSSPTGSSGPYQLHITVHPCVTAACCLHNVSDPEFPCVNGLTGEQCATRGGTFLGPPNRFPGVAMCSAGLCDVGACCVEPGVCADAADNGASPMTRSICEAAPLSGTFIPHLQCHGGRCEGDADLSCAMDADCAPFAAGRCLGDPPQLGQPPLCRICEYEDAEHCQTSGLLVRLADSSASPPARVAEDISPSVSGVLTTLCVKGAYDGPAGVNCQGLSGGVQDEFTVRVFRADATGVAPGDLLGTFASAVSVNRNAPFNPGNNRDCFVYQLQLIPDAQNALPFLIANDTYFVEVANSTPGGNAECYWHWLVAETQDGNKYAFEDRGLNYDAEDAAAFDLSLCTDLPFFAPAPVGGPVRACCTGEDERPCEILNLQQCGDIQGRWYPDVYSCGSLICLAAANDQCAGAIAITDGPVVFDNFATEREGAAQETCNSEAVVQGADIWFTYTATCTGTARLSTCHPESDGEHVISVYQSASTPAVCPCPGETGFGLLSCSANPQPNHVHAQGCPLSNGADLVLIVAQGNCYTIRISGELGTASIGRLRVTCGAAVCGNGAVEQGNGEQCDGDDDALCQGACDADCRCPNPVCGDGVAAIGLGEDCDGDDDAMCPGTCLAPGVGEFGCKCIGGCGNGIKEPGEQCDEPDDSLCPGACNPAGPDGCTCISVCGNGIREPNEDCDGTDDQNCPGTCGLSCNCPALLCGNNIVQPGNNEECDGTASYELGAVCDPADCRPPGDPAGECTCKCGPTLVVDLPPLLPNTFGTCNNAGNAACDTVLNNCTSPAVCEACNQTRYMGFKIPDTSAGSDTAIRIRLDALHNPVPPPVGTVPDFALIEGQDRYLNTLPGTLSRCCNPNSNPTSCNTAVSCTTNANCGGLGLNTTCYKNLCPDSTAFATFFRCARVGCTPEYRDWSDFAGTVTYATGDSVISSSSYSVSHLAASCAGSEASCSAASAALVVPTERWGNVDCSNPNFGIPNGQDIGRVVDKVKDAAGAFIKPRAHIRTAILDPASAVNAQDIGRIVDSVKGLQYPFNINCSATCTVNANCPGSSCVGGRCGTAPACTTTAQCTGFGLSAAHTCSTNGRCTTAKDSCTGLCQP